MHPTGTATRLPVRPPAVGTSARVSQLRPTQRRSRFWLMLLFLVGWTTFTFSLFDLGPYSITLLLLASIAWCKPQGWFRGAILCLLLSTILAAGVALLSSPGHRLYSHFAQQLICLGVVSGVSCLSLSRNLSALQRIMYVTATLLLIYSVYQLAARLFGLPGAFLPITNLQIGSDEGFQRGLSHNSFYRVSGTFAEPSDLSRYMLWVVAIAFGTKDRALKLRMMALGITGILVSQSMGGLVGLAALIIVVGVLRGHARVLLLSGGASILLGCLLLFLFPQLADTVVARAGRIFSEGDDYLVQTGRFRDLKDTFDIIGSAPLLGHGIGSMLTVAPDMIISSNIVVLLIERGAVGTLLFLAPFLLIWLRLMQQAGWDERSETAGFVLTVELVCLLNFSALYFPPMYFALALGMRALQRYAMRDLELRHWFRLRRGPDLSFQLARGRTATYE